jgi:hypothetical protein
MCLKSWGGCSTAFTEFKAARGCHRSSRAVKAAATSSAATDDAARQAGGNMINKEKRSTPAGHDERAYICKHANRGTLWYTYNLA